MRGADINFVNSVNGNTPLHRAIEMGLDPKIIKFLIRNGAYIHSEDKTGKDCCDKVRLRNIKDGLYNELKEFTQLNCIINPKLRQTAE